jgi:acetylornithine deacetylase
VSSRADEIVEWTKTLVRFASENRPPVGGEGPVQDFIAAECEKQGWEIDTFTPDEVPGIRDHPSWLPGRDYSGRKNVVARFPGRGGGRSLLLGGHADVAPFEPDNWKVCRPYEPVVIDGRLYGRGAADMKGGLAAAFWALRILLELGFEPAGDILFESVVDEEFAGGNGTLAGRLRGHNADMAVIGEPTMMQICPACLGAFFGDLTLTGSAGMPYTGSAIPNPINGAARAIELFNEWQKKWREENHHPMFTGPGKELNTLLWRIDSAMPGEFVQMGTPLIAAISWIVWCHPGTSEDEFRQRFQQFWNEHASDELLVPFELKFEPTYHHVRPWETPSDDPAVISLVDAFRRFRNDAPVVSGAPFSSDLAIYADVGNMPSIMFGPRGGNLHAPDEWVEVSDILDLTRIYATLAVSWS